jgi:hypothetical protein
VLSTLFARNEFINPSRRAFLGVVPLFDSRDLSRAAASILGDEAMHWAILRQVLGEDPVPAAPDENPGAAPS